MNVEHPAWLLSRGAVPGVLNFKVVFAFIRKMISKRVEIHKNVDNFCGKKVFVCKTRKWLWERCFLKMEVIHRNRISLCIKM